MCTCVLLESTDLPNLRNAKKHKNYLLLVRSKQPAFSYFFDMYILVRFER